MIFSRTNLNDVYIIDIEKLGDERGFFGRALCKKEFESLSLAADFVQCNIGFSPGKGTLRGMHYQKAPFEEDKLVRCTRGSIYDVAVDLRRDSPSYRQWCGTELSADNYKMMYIPKGCAHGYLTLTDDAEMQYHTSQFYAPEAASGIRYNDPVFGINWPADIRVVSEKDQMWPDFRG